MKKIILIITFFSLIIPLSGCLDDNTGKLQDIPADCLSAEGDPCALFECMVNICWCKYATPEGAILRQGSSEISSEQEAIAVVSAYVQSIGSEYTDVRKATQINTRFWNVFAYSPENDEEVFTVAKDGTILKTVCGV